MFAPDKVSILFAEVVLLSEPEPLITPDKVWSVEDASTRLAPFAMLTAPAYVPEPRLPEPPRVSVPALIVVPPV